MDVCHKDCEANWIAQTISKEKDWEWEKEMWRKEEKKKKGCVRTFSYSCDSMAFKTALDSTFVKLLTYRWIQ